MHASSGDMVAAYAAAVQALTSAAVRNLGAAEFDDPEVGAVVVEVGRDGAVDVRILNHAGLPMGGYSL